jgi:hypothetical protein
MDPKLKKWLCWIEVIKDEVSELIIAQHIFHEVQKLINDNPQLHQPSSFYDYLSQTYISHAVIGLRRQIKCGDQSISLARLLTEMIETPEILTRSYYVGLYEGSAVKRFANQDFEKFADPDAQYIDAKRVAADLSALRDASCRCEDFADKRIAHRDKRKPKKLPTFNEVDNCIALLNSLYVKYYLLFHASDMDSLLPGWEYDWKSIFRVPWIAPNDSGI